MLALNYEKAINLSVYASFRHLLKLMSFFGSFKNQPGLRATSKILFWRHVSSSTSPLPKSFAFSGCGWLSPYYFGVLQCLRDNNCLTEKTRYAGTSGGALAAVAGFCDMDTRVVLEAMVKISQVDDVYLDIDTILKNKVLALLSNHYNSHEGKSGEEAFLREVNDGKDRLSLCVSRVWPKPTIEPQLVSKFHSFQDLAEVTAASCFIPVWSKLGDIGTTTTISSRRRQRIVREMNETNEDTVVDGGFTAFMPPGCDVCISPFPEQYILRSMRKPHICLELGDISLPQLLYWVLNPASPAQLRRFYDLGYRSTEKFLEARERARN